MKESDKDRVRKRNTQLGFSTKEDIPIDRAKALLNGGYRISQRSDRKSFSKCVYGHKSGYSQSHMTKQDLRERADKNEDA